MKRLSSFACVALPGLGTIAALQTAGRTSPSDAGPSVVDQATNGAYRDGLYLGALAAGHKKLTAPRSLPGTSKATPHSR